MKMSYCRREGKDTIVFVTKEDHQKPSTVKIQEPEPGPGLIMNDGSINWNCPCLGGMATGPCGVEFREAFTCFHYSKAEPKGSNCFTVFEDMQNCMSRFPKVYDKDDEEDFSSIVDGDKDGDKNVPNSVENDDLESKKSKSVIDKKK